MRSCSRVEFAFNPGPEAIAGAIAVTAGAASYAVGASYVKYRIRSTDRYVVAGGTLVFAALYLWVVALIADGSPVLPTQPAAIIGLLWLGLLGSFFAYILYFFLIAHLGATVSTMVTYMFPVVGVTLGVVVLGEVLDVRLLLGAALVVLGIAIVGLRYDAVVTSQPAWRGGERIDDATAPLWNWPGDAGPAQAGPGCPHRLGGHHRGAVGRQDLRQPPSPDPRRAGRAVAHRPGPRPVGDDDRAPRLDLFEQRGAAACLGTPSPQPSVGPAATPRPTPTPEPSLPPSPSGEPSPTPVPGPAYPPFEVVFMQRTSATGPTHLFTHDFAGQAAPVPRPATTRAWTGTTGRPTA